MNRSRLKYAGSAVPWVGCLLIIGAALPTPLAAAEAVLHSFSAPFPKGGGPNSSLVRDAAGNLYGTTYTGGAFGAGTVYRVTAAGAGSLVYSFTGGADGGNPKGGVIGDGQGNLYGTTFYGGNANFGVVFKVNGSGQETVLYSFTGGADGGYPAAGLIRDADGNLYGTTMAGGNLCLFGPPGCGVVYKIDETNQETVLFTFNLYSGYQPSSGLSRDAEGNFYGTANGGIWGEGAIYKLDASGAETVLYNFQSPQTGDGEFSEGSLTIDQAGNLYGATVSGGRGGVYPCCGTVFEISPAGVESKIFYLNSSIGESPEAGVIRDAAGNLYGTASSGGASGLGTVFKIDSSGVETVLHSFTGGTDGSGPAAGLLMDAQGNLYGTTAGGGLSGGGVVYKIDPAGLETVLYAFPGSQGGSVPDAGVIRDSSGNFYGTTSEGGANNAGIVYETDAAGKETLLHSFTGGLDGGDPKAGVIRDQAGNLYGTTFYGGVANGDCGIFCSFGVVYKVDPSGKETVLHSFAGPPNDGAAPYSGLISDGAGNLYGTTTSGGANSFGTIYRIDASGTETVLYNFDAQGGVTPYGGLARDAAGNLYGTTSNGGEAAGTVYKLSPSGTFSVLHIFGGSNDGYVPYAGVILDGAGNLYGTTTEGGTGDFGVVYKIGVEGAETVLYNFTGGADGGTPYAGVVRDRAGNFYGTAQTGGANGKGVVYKVDTSGHETVLYSFTGADGDAPVAGLTFDSSGNIYGTAPNGGKYSGGVIFELTQ